MPMAIDLQDVGALDLNSRMPLYAQLADLLSSRIRDVQASVAGQALPTEVETAAHFGISRPTVRQAMGELLAEGLIVRGRGRGTFVAPPHASRDMGRITEFELLPPSKDVEFRLLKRETVVPPPDVRALFRLGKSERIQLITRLRYIDKKVFGYEERYMPVPLAASITDKVLAKEAGVTFVKRLIDGENGKVAFRFRAIPADTKHTKILDIKVGTPLLSSEHTYFTADDQPILHGVILFRGDRYDFGFMAPVHGRRRSR
jgi:GntR family transcriptional regulator